MYFNKAFSKCSSCCWLFIDIKFQTKTDFALPLCFC